MAKKLKDYYDIDYLESFSKKIANVTDDFDRKKFLQLTKLNINELEFKDRQVFIAKALHETIDLNYDQTLLIFTKILGPELKGNSGAFSEGWWLWPVGTYAELYGGKSYDSTVKFSKELTKRFTSEYCMRPIIKNYPEKTLEVLKSWSQDDNERVRRLSSECIRIRLPWAKKLYTALEYFEDYYIILTNLKDDEDKYIQKSVANNLNDLYKEDPEKFNYIVDSWTEESMSKVTEWIIKHGSRSFSKNN